MVIHGILVDFEVGVPIAGTFFWYLRLVFLQMQLQSSARVCPTNIADEREGVRTIQKHQDAMRIMHVIPCYTIEIYSPRNKNPTFSR